MVTILTGDCRAVLPTLAASSINCCVTSPPYWGLRDYGHAEQIGLEGTPEAYVAELVAVFAEVRRVLREDGTLWLNLGDSYASDPGKGGSGTPNGRNGRGENYGRAMRAWSGRADGIVDERGQRNRDGTPKGHGLKAKDLCGIPWRVAFALQADGWYLRQDIIWAKPNPMPESVTDRCTKAHEYMFLLSKSARYYYDADAIKEPSSGWNGSEFHDGKNLQNHPNVGKNRNHRDCPTRRRDVPPGSKTDAGFENGRHYDDRNKRSVWTVSTVPYKGAHFATFPPALIQPCILAGCPVGGTVLDPFGGSGTTGEVSESLGRNSVLIELNPDYIKLQKKRTAQGGLFCKDLALVTTEGR
jgi:DNA modification methylase